MIKASIDFFLPFEFDQVPKIWDPWNDTWNKKSGKLFIWDCFKNPPYDGILISKSKFDHNKKKYIDKLKKDKNLKNLLKIPENIMLFGDCGAFQYRNELKPPYTTQEILDYYQDYGFDMGCSIDHIITNKKDVKLREKRKLLTEQYAKECIDLFKSNKYHFELFGVAQGWDINSYSDMVKYLYELGYENICIGGLIGLKTLSKDPKEFTLVSLLKHLNFLFKKYNFKKIHIFGRGNISLFELYLKCRITQFDNNIMIKAYKSIKGSYYLFDTKKHQLNYFTSIRIPLVEKMKQGLHDKEKEIFKVLNQFNENQTSSDAFILELDTYYKTFKTEKNKEYTVNNNLIKKLLEEKPWEKCDCEICKNHKIHVCIFRRRMRNTLRAFHNVFNYYCYLKSVRASKINLQTDTKLTDFT